WGDPLGLLPGELFLATLEVWQDLFRKQVERRADVFMFIVAGLGNKHHLIDAYFFIFAQAFADEIRRTDAGVVAARSGNMDRVAPVVPPDVGLAGLVPAEHVVVAERVGEKLEPVLAHRPRPLLVRITHEAGHDGDVGIDRVADRLAFIFERAVVVVDPLARLIRRYKRKGQRADSELGGEVDGFAA